MGIVHDYEQNDRVPIWKQTAPTFARNSRYVSIFLSLYYSVYSERRKISNRISREYGERAGSYKYIRRLFLKHGLRERFPFSWIGRRGKNAWQQRPLRLTKVKPPRYNIIRTYNKWWTCTRVKIIKLLNM